jgi:hypothetical protein
MLKKLSILTLPTLVLTLAAFTGVGCHDNSGNGTNKPMPSGSAGADGGSDAPADVAASDAGDAKATETGGDAPKSDGGDTAALETGGDTAATEGGLDAATHEVELDALLGTDTLIGN